jgi:hypothetical protein
MISNAPLALCIVSIFLMSSGGMNFGFANTLTGITRFGVSAFGIISMIVGIAGMSLSFYFHIKSDKENPPT